MDELAGYDRQRWASWYKAMTAHAALLRSLMPRDDTGAGLDDTARQYVTHVMYDAGVREAQILEVDTGTVDFAIDTIVWTAPDGTTGIWPSQSADGTPGPDGWIEARLLEAARDTVDDLGDLHAQVPVSTTQATMLDDSLADVRRHLADLLDATRGRIKPNPPPPAPARATEDWESMAVASQLVGSLAAVNATAPDVEIAEPYVQMNLRGDDDAFEVKYRLGYPELNGAGAITTDERVGLPAVTVALYRSASAMQQQAAAAHGLSEQDVERQAQQAVTDTRWWLSADPRFAGLVHRIWDLCQLVGGAVSLSWTADGAWALTTPDGVRVDGAGVGPLETELDRRRAIARAKR